MRLRSVRMAASARVHALGAHRPVRRVRALRAAAVPAARRVRARAPAWPTLANNGALPRRGVLVAALPVVALMGAAGAYSSMGSRHRDAPAAPASTQPDPTAALEPPKAAAAIAVAPHVSAVAAQHFFQVTSSAHVPAAWERKFLPLYHEAERTFGVKWLLIASIHRQETAFSTSPSTYHGLNFFGCCAGPMQFNVKNGRVTTWDRFRLSYRAAPRPAHYGHQTATHPSVYDDFDAIMAGASLLAADGAGPDLDESAWWAAYDYYGHDLFGITYADEVLARALGWERHGFCINCGVDFALQDRIDAKYGEPVRAALIAAGPPRHHHHKKKKKHKAHAKRAAPPVHPRTSPVRPSPSRPHQQPSAPAAPPAPPPPAPTSTSTSTPTSSTPPASTSTQPPPSAPPPSTTPAPPPSNGGGGITLPLGL
jgi:hypothetical protein